MLNKVAIINNFFMCLFAVFGCEYEENEITIIPSAYLCANIQKKLKTMLKQIAI